MCVCVPDATEGLNAFSAGSPVATLFVSPSITPWRFAGSPVSFPRNPALRRVDFDPQSLQLTDIKQFYLKLPDANR